MILGDGVLAEGAAEYFDDVPFVWVLHEPPLPDLHADLDSLSSQTLVVLSTPAPLGTCARLEVEFPFLTFAVIPENTRLAHPEDWAHQTRFIVGVREESVASYLRRWLGELIVMSPESAELTKAALNGFLAVSVEYALEIARLARTHGANPFDVARGVMSDPRVGQRAYLKPLGEPGPHLLREINALRELGGGPVIDAVQ